MTMTLILVAPPPSTVHEMPHTKQRQMQFEQLVREWSADLYRFAYWLSREQDLAEELVQETFARAWKSLDQLQEPKAAKSWLFTILRREHARRFERKTIPITADCEPDTRPGKPTQNDSTEAFVLHQALQELPQEYREPLILQVIGGYSMDEIAQQLDLSKGAVMTRLFRARNKLRTRLEEPGDEM